MKHTLIASAISAVLTLGACASAPAYSPAQSAKGAGYSDLRIENDRFRVAFRSAPRMSSAEVQDYGLMHAAQLTLDTGGDWFEIINAYTDADAKRRYSTNYGYDTQYVVQRSGGVTGCSNRLGPVTVGPNMKPPRCAPSMSARWKSASAGGPNWLTR